MRVVDVDGHLLRDAVDGLVVAQVALDDILAKKVIRKLETQNPIYLRGAAEGLLGYLDELFGTDRMAACKAAIQRLRRNA